MRAGRQACSKARKKAYRKAVMSFVGSPAEGSAQEKMSWTSQMIPRARDPQKAFTSDTDLNYSQVNGWAGDQAQVTFASLKADIELHGFRHGKLPMVSMPSLTAPGPSGERPEHLRDCLAQKSVSGRRRLIRALDALTLQWAGGNVSSEARWLLNTSLTWLKKGDELELPEEDAMWL
eukprot:12054066-Karenia_brevis.AAC.1